MDRERNTTPTSPPTKGGASYSPTSRQAGSASGLCVGVDIGGTFTDLCVVSDRGIVAMGKVLTSHDEPARGVEHVIRQALEAYGLRAADVVQLVHGTTLVTNALIERKGASTALLTTEGFRDVIEMRREHRYELYDLMIELPPPLVPRHLRFDVPERVLADGAVDTPLNEAVVEQLASELADHGVEAVGICFLHSFTNPEHEGRAREAVRRAAPQLRVALSSEVVPEIREYERMSTTLANIYVQPLAERYLGDLRERVGRLGVPRQPHIMLSNGGLATIDTAARHPIRMLESGPAGGVLGGAAFAESAGYDDLLAFDMGGTTAKLCVVEDGQPLVTHEFEVDRIYRLRPGSGLPVKVPVIDMIEIGAGGGSVARVNSLGLLDVGPESAGSEPGPACYQLGGRRPTVTDADLVLGYLNPDYFLGGRMALDPDAAWNVIERQVAAPMGIAVPEAARGIHATVNENMASAARVHAIERGQDPSALPLFTFGGAGPVHGAGVASSLGSSRVVVPPAAGVMSALGFLTAPLSFDFVRSARAIAAELHSGDVEALFAGMEKEGSELLQDSGVAPEDVTHARYAEMRYAGQGAELRVPVPEAARDWPQALIHEFSACYHRQYGRAGPDVAVEVLSWRVVSSGPIPEVSLQLQTGEAGGEAVARKGERSAYFPELDGYSLTPVYARYALSPGTCLEGPALIEEHESTLVVPPKATCSVGTGALLTIDLEGRR